MAKCTHDGAAEFRSVPGIVKHRRRMEQNILILSTTPRLEDAK